MSKSEVSINQAFGYISESSIYGNLGLFIGAGMSKAIINTTSNTIALSWKELIYKCAEGFDINITTDINTDGLSYPEIASEIVKLISKNENVTIEEATIKLKNEIADLTCWYPEKTKRDEYGKLLKILDPKWIITTNYDLIIESILHDKSIPLSPFNELISPKNLIPVYHLHGIRTNPDSIIITQEDYIQLFRPNQYRQHKLSLSFKESTTLIIGYKLSDVNVLTALDWSKNVYANNQEIKNEDNYPNKIIQLLFVDNPSKTPYITNKIIVIEFNNLLNILKEISDYITKEIKIEEKKNGFLNEIDNILKNPSDENVHSFINNREFRFKVIDIIKHKPILFNSGFFELLTKSIDKLWIESEEKNNFDSYDKTITIILDIIENIELKKLQPALIEFIAFNLEKISKYIGPNLGQSRKAFKTWESRKNDIPENILLELRNIARLKNIFYFNTLLRFSF